VPFDDDAEADLPSYRPPPHPDDRLWRHPSEMSGRRIVPADAPEHATDAAPPTTTPGENHGRRPWAAFVAAGTVGALLAGGGVVALGLGERVIERPVTERVELDPSAPALGADVDALENVRQQAGAAVVAVNADGSGSGVIIRDDGIVVTSAAFTADGTAPAVSLPDGRVVAADLIGSDPVTGLAVLDLKGEGHTPSVLGTSGGLRSGDHAFTLHVEPSGDTATETGTVGISQRYVGPMGGALDGLEIDGPADAAAIGGPVVDERGAVVGVVTAVEDGAAWYVAPIEMVDRVTTDLLADGVAHHAWLGIEGADITDATDTPSDADTMSAGDGTGDTADDGAAGSTDGDDGDTGDDPGDSGVSGDAAAAGPAGDAVVPGGTLVASVVADSPAALGGLRAGDVIVAYNGRPISRTADLTLCLRTNAPGDRVDLTLARQDGSEATLVFTLAEAPPLSP
jgi:S1-C subfamily serine protease